MVAFDIVLCSALHSVFIVWNTLHWPSKNATQYSPTEKELSQAHRF